MAQRAERRARAAADLPRAVEALSRDLLALTRGVRVYPPGHPFLRDLGERLVAIVRRSLPDPLNLGVTSSELAVGSSFVGGRGSRASQLAVLLHARKVVRVRWARGATPREVTILAGLLADPKAQAEGIRRALQEGKVYSLDVEALALDRIHESFREGSRREGAGREGREAWLWLLNEEVSPERVAEFLASEGVWEGQEQPGLRGGDTPGLTALLVRMGQRLGAALDCLPPGRREEVEGRLAQLGRRLSPSELAEILRGTDQEGDLQGPAVSMLEQAFRGERLVDLLAGLVALEGRSTRRLADVYRRFAPGGEAEALLPVVRARLSTADRSGFAAEVWEVVEEFLLGLQEDPFMGADYSTSLDEFASVAESWNQGFPELDLQEAPEPHLDRIILGLAIQAPGEWTGRFVERLDERVEGLPPNDLLRLLAETDRGLPGALGDRADLVERAFLAMLSRLRELDSPGRSELLRFALRHEEVLLEPVLRILAQEERIAVRRFLVDLASHFSPSATPILVSRVRSAPWYVTRNLTIALGRKGESIAVPAVRSLLHHEHPKVRREAIIALGGIGSPAALEALESLAEAVDTPQEDRELALRALRVPKGRGENP